MRPSSGGALLSVREVAQRLGVCAATVYRLCEAGALPHMRILNAVRVAVGDFEAFVAAKGSRQT